MTVNDEDVHIDWNPVMVEQAIYRAAQRIAKGVLAADKAYRDFLKADHEFDKAEARAYLSEDLQTRPVHERKFRVVLDPTVQEARDKRDVAEAAYKLMDKNMKAIQGELDALRSIGTSVRQAYQSAGTGER